MSSNEESHHSGGGGHSHAMSGGGDSNLTSTLYLLAIVILLSSIIISASVFFSVSSFSAGMGAWAPTVSVQAPPSAPSPSAPSPPPSPSTAPRPPSAPAKIDLSGLPFQGPANAKVTVVEYADFQCPFCARAYPTVKQLMGDYSGKVKFYFKSYPLPFHQNAQKAAEAYECALAQGKSWEYHDKLFENGQGDGTGLNNADLKKYAADLGLDTATFNSCLDGGQMASRVAAEAAEGSRNGVSGTPTFFINGQPLVGAQPYGNFKSIIDQQLAG